MMIPVIRNSCGEIIDWYESKALAESELAYLGEEEYEVSEATIEEVFDAEFGDQTIEEILEEFLDITPEETK